MALKILSVDDETDLKLMLKQKFRKQIKAGELEFYFAHTGLEALEVLKEQPLIEVVLADVNMPGMDGLSMLDEIRQMQLPFLQTIMVSAYSDMTNLRKAMNKGAFDFVTKPIDFEDLEITIKKTVDHITQLKKSAEISQKLSSLEEELNVAKRIQLSLVPKIFPPFPNRNDIEIFASMNAAKSVGGDFYDFFFIDEDFLGFVIGDVSGKGIPAALFMAVSKNIIHSTAIKTLDPAACLKEANELLCQESVDCMFATVFYGILNLKNGDFSYSNGGHNPPYIISNSGEVKELEPTNNAILGGMPDLDFDTLTINLNRGDAIFSYTDGIPEAENIDKTLYSQERLENLLAKNNQLELEILHDAVIDDVHAFVGDAPQSDDLTILSFRYL